MKKIFTNNLLRPLLLLTTMVVGGVGAAQAQVATNYTFVASSGSFTPVSGSATATSLVATADDAISTAFNIGFPFTYNGIVYTQLMANSNGTLLLGTGRTATEPSWQSK